ncbi:hypothetical protein OH76DRAFT_686991 [Lentinus brumalis]|uniref:Uncharacterized protein n=1 Tax=Lentinus brumalis TaxID=2498619 RepID=A0A371CH22_9APHY|nr:hypothetical protein OH76DRAFT_686991 [Polyporus brumalis]
MTQFTPTTVRTTADVSDTNTRSTLHRLPSYRSSLPSSTRGCSIKCCLSHAQEEEYARARAFRPLQACNAQEG